MSTPAYNPHKVQGEEPWPKLNHLCKEDLLLFQKDMTVKFGCNIICFDATHGTTMYDFLLITILVIDEHGEIVPVAWVLSNKEDKIH